MTTLRLIAPGQKPPLRDPRGPAFYASLFGLSVTAFLVLPLAQEGPNALRSFLDVASLVTCGLAWLLTRSLFRNDRALWPDITVAALFLVCLLTRDNSAHPIAADYMVRLKTVLGSAMLILVLVEVLDRPARDTAIRTRLRPRFAIGYGAILCLSFLSETSLFAPYSETLQRGLAAFALIGAGLAVLEVLRCDAATPVSDRSGDRALAAAIVRLVEGERLYLDPDLRVATLAKALRVPPYRVSRAIGSELGHANFNRFVNRYRIEVAKDCLADPACDSSILVIALDSGFASLGPFNRTFKSDTGMTPSDYRRRNAVRS